MSVPGGGPRANQDHRSLTRYPPSPAADGLILIFMFISRPHPWPTSANQILNLSVHRWAIS